MPHSRSHLFEEINEITLLFNCFTLGFYALHIMPVIIPNFVEGYFAKVLVKWLAPPCVIYRTCIGYTLQGVLWNDAGFRAFFGAVPGADRDVGGRSHLHQVHLPARQRHVQRPGNPCIPPQRHATTSTAHARRCQKTDQLFLCDQDTIAEVYHEMTLLISEKNAIKKQLMKVGMQLAHDVGMVCFSQSKN
jgi:hypothetical protein